MTADGDFYGADEESKKPGRRREGDFFANKKKPENPGKIKVGDFFGADKRPKEQVKKRGLVKTLTIKKRKLEIYFPTEEAKKNLLMASKAAGMSSSKYILSVIGRNAPGVLGPSLESIVEVRKEIAAIKTELEATKQENERLKTLLARYETDNAKLKYREVPIREKPPEDGEQEINPKLIKLFKKKIQISSEDIINGLGLDLRDKKAVTSLWKNLWALKSYGLVEQNVGGWKWLGK
jgi:uncharacterized protein (DUF1778 family)